MNTSILFLSDGPILNQMQIQVGHFRQAGLLVCSKICVPVFEGISNGTIIINQGLQTITTKFDPHCGPYILNNGRTGTCSFLNSRNNLEQLSLILSKIILHLLKCIYLCTKSKANLCKINNSLQYMV